MRRKGWSDLPPDLLREIATRLHVAADFVTFHAICKPWRSSLDPLFRKQLLPWLLVPTESSSPLKLRCVFAKSSYRVLPPPYPRRRTNWVCSDDGATVRYLTAAILHDPITGAVTHLPPFPCYHAHHWEENSRGIVYGDGTVFLYDISYVGSGSTRFRALLLRPGEEEWRPVDSTFETDSCYGGFCATYHRGRILVTVEWSRVVMLHADDGDSRADVLVPRPWGPGDHVGCWERYSYILESRGELLWASVGVRRYYKYYYTMFLPQIDTIWVSVHALEEGTAAEKARWVRKGGHCLADRVLFLGSPNSFAVDASLLGGQGGCAYFVYHNSDVSAVTHEQFGVFRYNFVDGKFTCIGQLPQECDNQNCTWLVPRPAIAPVKEMIKRKLEACKLKKQHKTAPVTSPSRIFHIERHYEHRFRVVIRNLPLNVKNSHLQLFFSKHGKVSSTEIIYQQKNTKTSHGTGVVRVATMHARQEDALAALDRFDFDGCSRSSLLMKGSGEDSSLKQNRLKAPFTVYWCFNFVPLCYLKLVVLSCP